MSGIARWFLGRSLIFYVMYVVVLGVLTSLSIYVFTGLLYTLLVSLSIIPPFLVLVMRGRLWAASGIVLLWSLVATIVVSLIFAFNGCNRDLLGRVPGAERYVDEMFRWVLTGRGAEGDPSVFLVPKTVELLVFIIVSFVTVGVGGLFMGAYLLDYMNAYYGVLVWASSYNPVSILMGWPIYAILRVVGYTFMGTFLSSLSMDMLRKRTLRLGLSSVQKKIFFLSIALIIADYVLKATIANTVYQPVLASVVVRERIYQCIGG